MFASAFPYFEADAELGVELLRAKKSVTLSNCSLADGVVAVCASLGLDHQDGGGSLAFQRCTGQEELFRWPFLYLPCPSCLSMTRH